MWPSAARRRSPMQSGDDGNNLTRLRPGDELPPATVTARNPSTASENKIHDNEVARRYGFRGGLVPGVIVYAYTTIPLNAALGESWLTGSEVDISFINPAYENDALTARENATGERCSTGTAIVTAAEALVPPLTLPDYLDVPPSAPPNPRPELQLENAPIGVVLAPLTLRTSVEEARDYARMVHDDNPIFTTGSIYGPPLMHPGWLLSNCNTIFTQNYRFGPWIHTRSQIRYLGPALAGKTFIYHGRFADAYERRGHHYAVLALFCVDDGGQPILQVRHTSIFKV